MVRAVARRAVTMPIDHLVAREQPVERGDEVVIRPGADLENDEPSGRVRDEDREEPVRLGRDEPGAGLGQVEQTARGAGLNAELVGPYGKMLRSASRIRPSPPPTGVDS